MNNYECAKCGNIFYGANDTDCPWCEDVVAQEIERRQNVPFMAQLVAQFRDAYAVRNMIPNGPLCSLMEAGLETVDDAVRTARSLGFDLVLQEQTVI